MNKLENLEIELKKVKNKGWIDSINPKKNSDKDVGLTLERELGILPNSSTKPDFLDEIELKSKRMRSKTLDTLFAKTPDWSLSTKKNGSTIPYEKSIYYLLEFGIPSPKYPGYKTLYLTIDSRVNKYGMFLEKDDNKQQLFQHFSRKTFFNRKKIEASCIWSYSTLRNSFEKKHNQTVWILADNRKHEGIWQFKYREFEYTQKPKFEEFLKLIKLDGITIDWTHRVREDGTNYNDHGFLFRIKPKFKDILFGILKPICQ